MTLFIESFISLFAEMAPYLLLGFLLAGVLHVWVPKSFYLPKISKPNFKSVLWATLFGVPLPICSCGVIPTAIALRREGASRGASVSFLISTPATGADSILATYSIMGFPFAILRVIAAFFTAIIGGLFTNWTTKSEAEPVENLSLSEEKCGCHKEQEIEKTCCEKKSEKSCCENEDTEDEGEVYFNEKSPMTLQNRFIEMWRYGFVELLGDITRWLLVGLVFGALISAFVPNDFFLGLRQYPILASLLVLVLAMPMYTCATGSIPLAMALVAKGMTPGAALVLLMAGPATSMASIFVIGKSMGKRTLVGYLLSIAFGALFVGWVIDTFFMEFFLGSILSQAGLLSENHHISVLDSFASVTLAILMIYSFRSKKAKKEEKKSCSCH